MMNRMFGKRRKQPQPPPDPPPFFLLLVASSLIIGKVDSQHIPSCRLARPLIFLIAIVLLSATRIPLPRLYLQLWPAGFWPFWLGAVVTIAGLLFAVWAREHLGSNWSRSVTIKQGYELVTPGPYTVIRHPIYTGILTGSLSENLVSCCYPFRRKEGTMKTFNISREPKTSAVFLPDVSRS